MISTGPIEWIVTRPLAFGMQVFAPADTTIGNSKTFESESICAGAIAGCAAKFNVVAPTAIKPAAQDIGNVIFIVISLSSGLLCFAKWRRTMQGHRN
jgi:hypothetical protein